MREVRQSPGRGRGVFASRAIAAGEIIERSPVLRLPAADREHVDRTALYDHYFTWGEDIAVGAGFSSLYNHSYSPNAVYEKVLAADEIEFRALRDIAAGEEILVNYNCDPGGDGPMWFDVA